MRSRSVVPALIALTAVTATVVARRLAARKRRAAQLSVPARPTAPVVSAPVTAEVPLREAVVLPFTRPAAPAAKPAAAAPAAPAAPARCGDTGGRTKAGSPCSARATSGGRCHHHRLAI
jgi:hypothetical protein